MNDLEILELETVIETLDTLYELGEDCVHPITNEIVSDAEYDQLRDKLRNLSPNSRIFNGVTASQVVAKKTITHNPPLTSLNKANGSVGERTEVLNKWLDSISKELGYQNPENEIVQAYKRDGVSLALYYERGRLVRAGIRPRDGVKGEDLTENAKNISGVPLELWEHDKDGNKVKFLDVTCSIRGEVECNKKVFRKIVEDWQDVDYHLDSCPKNERNYAAGSFRQLDPQITKARKLNFVAYSIVGWTAADNSAAPFKTEIERAKYSNAILRVPFVQVRPFRRKDLETLENFAPSLDYKVDGIVLSVNNLEDSEQMGTHGGALTDNPKSKIAWKFADETAVVEVTDIIWTPGRSGKLTPVLIFDPVQLEGTTVTQCTGHSLGFVEGSSKASLGKISKWAKVRIVKSGKIIPKVVGVVSTGYMNFNPPTHCPSCKTKLVVKQGEDGSDLVCESDFCGVRATAKIVHFLNSLGIKGISDATINRLVTEELVSDFASLYELNADILHSIGFSKRQSLLFMSRLYFHPDPTSSTDSQLEQFIQNAPDKFEIEAWQFFAALGISGTGKTAGQTLINHFGSFQNVYDATLEQLQSVDGIGDVSANSILDFFDKNEELIDTLLKIFNLVGRKQGKLTGTTFVFTGGFENGKSYWEKMVSDEGGTISNSVSKNTNYVVVGTDAGSKLQKAQQLNVKTITVDELKGLV